MSASASTGPIAAQAAASAGPCASYELMPCRVRLAISPLAMGPFLVLEIAEDPPIPLSTTVIKVERGFDFCACRAPPTFRASGSQWVLASRGAAVMVLHEALGYARRVLEVAYCGSWAGG
jgi:hypothetical protein